MSTESVRQLSRSEEAAASNAGDSGAVTPTTRLGDQLSHRIAKLIERGEFNEGSRLPAEIEFADRFGVSRQVIREALSRLRVAGVIVSRKGSGSYVRKRSDHQPRTVDAAGFGPVSSLAQVRKCFEFRATVESDAAFYAAQNRTPEMLLIMCEALDGMETAIANGVVGANPDCEFHLAVARASGNEFFETVMQLMRTPVEFAVDLARSLALLRPLEHLLTVQAEHIAIFEAIKAKDRDKARLAMKTHVDNACSRIFEGPGAAGEPLRSLKGTD